jgi:hypothetical protein
MEKSTKEIADKPTPRERCDRIKHQESRGVFRAIRFESEYGRNSPGFPVGPQQKAEEDHA